MPNSDVTKPDGTMAFDGGVDSLAPTTVASQTNSSGLKRNQLAWLVNGTTRDGGISPRDGWQPICKIHDASGLYQRGFIYEPDNAFPYLIVSVSGKILKIDLTTGNVTNLSVPANLFGNPTEPLAYFVKAEQFLIIQAGDFGKGGAVVLGTTDGGGNTLPLFWDGNNLRRSKGITNTAIPAPAPGVNEIPAGTAMDYYMGRVWYAQGRIYSAGDIVGGAAGTPAYRLKDAVLNVTENPLCFGGDGFSVPDSSGNIRSICHNANLNTSLGQGQLFIGTTKKIFSLSVPVTRADWISTTTNNQPVQTIVQLANGTVGDGSVVQANGDLFYQSLEPGIRSLFTAVRYFNQWGNKQISSNVQRVLQFVDRSLLKFSSGIYFDNFVLQTTLPKQTPQGVVHQGIIPLDLTPISNLSTDANPIWEGMYEGLDVFQLFTADFGGLERAFAVARAKDTGDIILWELVSGSRTENGDGRITFVAELPAFDWGNVFDLKKLVASELWVDRLWGTVNFKLEWRPDGDTCWRLWHVWKQCSAKNCEEDVNNPCTYPIDVDPNGESFRQTMTIGKPPEGCIAASGRPAHIGYQFQFRITVKGYCRIRGFIAHTEAFDRKLYADMQCGSTEASGATSSPTSLEKIEAGTFTPPPVNPETADSPPPPPLPPNPPDSGSSLTPPTPPPAPIPPLLPPQNYLVEQFDAYRYVDKNGDAVAKWRSSRLKTFALIPESNSGNVPTLISDSGNFNRPAILLNGIPIISDGDPLKWMTDEYAVFIVYKLIGDQTNDIFFREKNVLGWNFGTFYSGGTFSWCDGSQGTVNPPNYAIQLDGVDCEVGGGLVVTPGTFKLLYLKDGLSDFQILTVDDGNGNIIPKGNITGGTIDYTKGQVLFSGSGTINSANTLGLAAALTNIDARVDSSGNLIGTSYPGYNLFETIKSSPLDTSSVHCLTIRRGKQAITNLAYPASLAYGIDVVTNGVVSSAPFTPTNGDGFLFGKSHMLINEILVYSKIPDVDWGDNISVKSNPILIAINNYIKKKWINPPS